MHLLLVFGQFFFQLRLGQFLYAGAQQFFFFLQCFLHCGVNTAGGRGIIVHDRRFLTPLQGQGHRGGGLGVDFPHDDLSAADFFQYVPEAVQVPQLFHTLSCRFAD